MTVPTSMRALVGEKGKPTVVKEVPVPKLDKNDVLIKVEYAAQNPTDWKHAADLSPPESLIGCDFSGHVVALPSDPSTLTVPLKVGDKVAGCVHGGLWPNEGSFAEYAKAQSDLVWRVNEDVEKIVGMEGAATFGVPWITAAQVMIHRQGGEWPPATVPRDTWYLIYGASSSVGLFALRLAFSMGYKPLAVCSPHNFELVKSYNAAATVDYHDAEKAIEEIKRITGGGVNIGIDCISEGGSHEITLKSFGEKGGRLNLILPAQEDLKKIRSDVEIDNTMMYTLLGKPFKIPEWGMDFKGDDNERAFGVEWAKRTPEMITKYGIKANPIEHRGGLDDVLKGFEDMKAGKNSAKKYVYKIAQ